MENILLIDKPAGMTSHDVVDRVRRLTGEKRVGHAGTLDPLATGLLIVLVGREATKRQAEFLHLDKKYECVAGFGVETDTYDREGKVVATAPWEKVMQLTRDDVENVLPQFRGKIQQRVPAFSAVKVKGKKLYEKARKNSSEIVRDELPVRTVEIFSLEIVDFEKNEKKQKIFCTLLIHCGSGTYIRSLVHDLGQILGIGATVSELRRTEIGSFSVKNAQEFF